MKYSAKEATDLVYNLLNISGNNFNFSMDDMKIKITNVNNKNLAEGNFRIILSQLSKDIYCMAWAIDKYTTHQVVGQEIAGIPAVFENITEDEAYKKALEISEKANADMLWPEMIDSLYLAVFNFKLNP